MKTKRGAPRKPESQAKGATKQIRLNPVELATFQAAADLSGIAVSAWMRERLRAAARAELEAAGREVPFLTEAKKNKRKAGDSNPSARTDPSGGV
jgi:hypothetical protein